MNNLDKIKAKIAQMLQLSKDKGATEAEAENAISMANALMEKYSITIDDLKSGTLKKSDFVGFHGGQDRTKQHEIDLWCSTWIAKFCDVEFFVMRGKETGYVFFGYNVDVELAKYLRDLLVKTSEYEWRLYSEAFKKKDLINPKTNKPFHMKTIRQSWFTGFCLRINERLCALKADMLESETGTALVVMKSSLVKAALNDFIDQSKTKTTEKKKTFYTAPADAGKDAANRAKIHREVNTNKQERIK